MSRRASLNNVEEEIIIHKCIPYSDRLDYANKLQTLQVYKRVEKVPASERIKRITEGLKVVKKVHHTAEVVRAPYEHEVSEVEALEVPQLKFIQHQNILINIEKLLTKWERDYRELIDDLRELDRRLIKNDHDIERSDREAKRNVGKVRRIEKVKEIIIEEFKDLCLEKEDIEDLSKLKIQSLENELYEANKKIDELQYTVTKLMK